MLSNKQIANYIFLGVLIGILLIGIFGYIFVNNQYKECDKMFGKDKWN